MMKKPLVIAALSLVFFANVSLILADQNSVTASSTTVPARLSISPLTALKWLREGNARYAQQQTKKQSLGPSTRQRLASGQNPHSIVVTCADSRVPPEYIFDQGLGDLFITRVAGQALDPAVIASIEYAVEHLGTRLILVMGHTQCGAVKAAMTTPPGKSLGSAHLDHLVDDIRPRLSDLKGKNDLTLASNLNAEVVARDLIKRSLILQEKVKLGRLEIHSALYHLDSGVVVFHDHATVNTPSGLKSSR